MPAFRDAYAALLTPQKNGSGPLITPAAMALKRPELGTLKVGSIGDASILSVKSGEFDYVDVVGEQMTSDKRIFSEGVVIAGRWWHPKDRSSFRRPSTVG